MNCRACRKEIADGSVFCNYCGRKQENVRRKQKRANGTGCIYKLPDGGYKAIITIGQYVESTGSGKDAVRTVKTKTRVTRCKTVAEANAAIEKMKLASDKTEQAKGMTFQELYEKWLPTHTAGKSTMDCYRAAMNYFKPLWPMRMSDIDVDDIQDCISSCGKGKRTQENMRAVCGLMYKYGIPRNVVRNNLNLAQYVKVSGEKGVERESFTEEHIEAIRKQIGKVYGAEYVYCLIYLGFRPSEFLDLDCKSYDTEKQVVTGGAKTEAGKNRGVTVSPKIQKYMQDILKRKGSKLICDKNGNGYRLEYFTDSVFYPVLEAAKIDNPLIESAGRMVHRFTPHSCRHTFATLMKKVPGFVKDKCKLIGHSSAEMLHYYEDVSLDDMRQITDAI